MPPVFPGSPTVGPTDALRAPPAPYAFFPVCLSDTSQKLQFLEILFIIEVLEFSTTMNYDKNSILSLISHIHSQSQTFLQKKLTSLGLSQLATSHGNILFCLSRQEPLSLGELSKKINRDKSTTTALVKKLEQAGLVEQKKDLADSRKKQICLTPQGRQYTQKTDSLSAQLINQSWQNFTPNEQLQLVALLNRLSKNLEE